MSNAVEAPSWIEVCHKEDLVENSGVCVLVKDEQIAIFYLPEMSPAIYAIGNWDPCGNANVLSRGIVAEIGGEITVASPLYKQHFSLTSGQCLEDEEISIPVYEVSLDGDLVVIKS